MAGPALSTQVAGRARVAAECCLAADDGNDADLGHGRVFAGLSVRTQLQDDERLIWLTAGLCEGDGTTDSLVGMARVVLEQPESNGGGVRELQLAVDCLDGVRVGTEQHTSAVVGENATGIGTG